MFLRVNIFEREIVGSALRSHSNLSPVLFEGLVIQRNNKKNPSLPQLWLFGRVHSSKKNKVDFFKIIKNVMHWELACYHCMDIL